MAKVALLLGIHKRRWGNTGDGAAGHKDDSRADSKTETSPQNGPVAGAGLRELSAEEKAELVDAMAQRHKEAMLGLEESERSGEDLQQALRSLDEAWQQLTGAFGEKPADENAAQALASIERDIRALRLEIMSKARAENPEAEVYVPRDGHPIVYETASSKLEGLLQAPLRPLDKENGEWCFTETQFEKEGFAGFTAGNGGRVKTADDVAYMFRKLESAQDESIFAVLVKDGESVVLHLGTGGKSAATCNLDALRGGVDRVAPDEVYFVHNHPSGTMMPSREDCRLLDRVRALVPTTEVRGLIIDTWKREYCEFGDETRTRQRVDIGGEQVPVNTWKMAMAPWNMDYKPEAPVRSSMDAAALIANRRLAATGKIGYIIFDRAGMPVANICTPYGGLDAVRQAAVEQDMISNGVRFAGSSVIIYGSDASVKDEYALRDIKERLGVAGIMLSDSIYIRGRAEGVVGDGYRYDSAADDGLLGEPGAEYGEAGDIEWAKSNGTYMKAQNGKHSGLSEEQWAQVHTKAFKDWFGNWEMASLFDMINKAWNDPQYKVTYKWSPSERAKERFKELTGKDIDAVVLEMDAVRHIKKNHGENEAMRGQEDMTPEQILLLPYLIDNFDTMEFDPKHDDSLGNKAIEIRTRINGTSVIATLQKGKNKSFIVSGWRMVKSNALDASTETPGPNVRNDFDAAKVQKDIENIIQSAKNSSKAVDENGEPMVVDGLFLSTNVDISARFEAMRRKVQRAADLCSSIKSEAGGNLEAFMRQSQKNAEEVFFLDDATEAMLDKMLKGIPVNPEPVVAFRYGDIREEGKSWNYRDSRWEDGVSVVGRVAELNAKRSGYYENFFGSEPYNVVFGFDLGDRGADGEMLLRDAVSLGSDVGRVAKSASTNNGEFSAQNADISFRLGEGAETFGERMRRAVENRGTVMPGLAEAEVKVVDVPRHGYKGTGLDVLKQAVDSAVKRYKGHTLLYNKDGQRFEYTINSKDLKYAANHSSKSDNIGVHAAVMDRLDSVIGESVEVMEHADVHKVEGTRAEENGYNENTLMHRFVGAVSIDGQIYRVITTLKEHSTGKNATHHTYEVTKIEVLDAETPSTPNVTTTRQQAYVGIAKLLKTRVRDKKVAKKLEKWG